VIRLPVIRVWLLVSTVLLAGACDGSLDEVGQEACVPDAVRDLNWADFNSRPDPSDGLEHLLLLEFQNESAAEARFGITSAEFERLAPLRGWRGMERTLLRFETKAQLVEASCWLQDPQHTSGWMLDGVFFVTISGEAANDSR